MFYERFDPAAAEAGWTWEENVRLLVYSVPSIGCLHAPARTMLLSTRRLRLRVTVSQSRRARWWRFMARTFLTLHDGGRARRRGLDEHELTHLVFEHGVSEGIRLAESQRDRARPVARFDESVFDIPAIARQMGCDEHELCAMCLNSARRRACGGWRRSMRTMPARLSFMAVLCRSRGCVWPWTSSSPSLRSGRLAKPQSSEKRSDPVSGVNMVWEFGIWPLISLLRIGEKLDGRLDGYLATVGGKILDSKVRVGSLGAWAHGGGGHSSEAFGWQFWWRSQRWLPSGNWGLDVLKLWQD